jgi:hypothetical protein
MRSSRWTLCENSLAGVHSLVSFNVAWHEAQVLVASVGEGRTRVRGGADPADAALGAGVAASALDGAPRIARAHASTTSRR